MQDDCSRYAFLDNPGQDQVIRLEAHQGRIRYSLSASYLLHWGSLVAFQTCSHTSRTESSLSDIPNSVDHGIENEGVPRRPESKTTANITY